MELLKNIDVLLIANPTNIRYLAGFVSVAPEERESYVLLTKKGTFLFTNSLYLEAAKKSTNLPIYQSTNKLLEVVEISRENPLEKQLNKIVKTENIKRLGFEEENLTVAELNKLKQELKSVSLVPTKNRIEELRIVKRDDEIKNIRAAAKLTDECFDFILSKLTPGVEERKIAWEIESFFRKQNAELAFSPIVAFGKNSSQPHYLTGSDPVNKQQGLTPPTLVLLDLGSRFNGYCSDMTRVVFIGKPKDEWRRTYEAVREAQQKVLDTLARHSRERGNPAYNKTGSPIRSGMTTSASGAQLDLLARESIQKSGFPPYPHSLGHGVGLAIHEQPRLSIKKDQVLKPGMIITIEPGIYKEGVYGIRIEDLVLLKEGGIEILSRSTKRLTIL